MDVVKLPTSGAQGRQSGCPDPPYPLFDSVQRAAWHPPGPGL